MWARRCRFQTLARDGSGHCSRQSECLRRNADRRSSGDLAASSIKRYPCRNDGRSSLSVFVPTEQHLGAMVGGLAARDRPGWGCCAQRKCWRNQPGREQRFQDILIRLATAAGTVLFCSGTATIGQRPEKDRANEVTYDHWLDITLCIPSAPPARDSKISLL